MVTVECVCCKTPFEIILEQKVIDKIRKKLSRYHKKEFRIGYMFWIIKNGKVTIEDVYVPKQKSDRIKTEIPPDKAMEAIKKYKKGLVGLVFYNVNMPCYESMVTREARTIFNMYGVYNLGLIVNSKGEHKLHPTIIR